ncbi:MULTISPECIES: hypothetical protein [unclassified Paenibacillus]|uniref:Uncharacterized protein n=1 Tax=Paenibacillus provencensis TaxID=441151 RepID=A0ABW3Q0N8_9BACL|nr:MULTISPECIES: hypothetical protein [unclassified Paenibacillus]MCM3130061.1 hypothetical protein [Paenibacillus sp. MER 78]SFS62010.1 hypothetical protein SAMN04488601_1012783 [Paenibacillus sp. 453mf]
MELIERYVYAVTQRLPEKQRADISKELHGLIEDMLEERASSDELKEQQVESVLIELGHPEMMAARYEGERYLIGPALYTSYMTVMKVVLASFLIALSIFAIVEAIMTPGNILDHFTDFLIDIVISISQAIAWVTVIFALIEYGQRRRSISPNNGHSMKEWNPKDLQSLPDHGKEIKKSDPIASIIFITLFTALFALNVELIAVYQFNDQGFSSIPFISSAGIEKYIPFIWLLGAVGILGEIFKLILRKRTTSLLAYHIIFTILSFVLAWIMLHDSSFWNASFMSQLETSGLIPPGQESYEIVSNIWSGVIQNLIYVIAIISLVDLGSEIYKWNRSKKFTGRA